MIKLLEWKKIFFNSGTHTISFVVHMGLQIIILLFNVLFVLITFLQVYKIKLERCKSSIRVSRNFILKVFFDHLKRILTVMFLEIKPMIDVALLRKHWKELDIFVVPMSYSSLYT